MRRIITGLIAALAITAFVPTAAAQLTDKMRRVGFLSTYSETDQGSQRWHEAFRKGLRDNGWVVGENISIDYRLIADSSFAGRRAPATRHIGTGQKLYESANTLCRI